MSFWQLLTDGRPSVRQPRCWARWLETCGERGDNVKGVCVYKRTRAYFMVFLVVKGRACGETVVDTTFDQTRVPARRKVRKTRDLREQLLKIINTYLDTRASRPRRVNSACAPLGRRIGQDVRGISVVGESVTTADVVRISYGKNVQCESQFTV